MSDNSDMLQEVHAMQVAQGKRNENEVSKPKTYGELQKERDLLAYRGYGMLESLLTNGLLPHYLVANAKDIVDGYKRLMAEMDRARS